MQLRLSTRPSLDFFLLSSQSNASGIAAHGALIDAVNATIHDYNSNGNRSITVVDLRAKFISELLYAGPKERSLLSSLYSFLLEYPKREEEITLRSDTGGSIQPFLDHLFDGARILESLLEKGGNGGDTLRPKIKKATALMITPLVLKSSQTLQDAEREYNNQISLGSTFQDCNIAAAFIIRNTTGHSLLWPDQFASSGSYKLLYNTVVNSIFWTIEKLWL